MRTQPYLRPGDVDQWRAVKVAAALQKLSKRVRVSWSKAEPGAVIHPRTLRHTDAVIVVTVEPGAEAEMARIAYEMRVPLFFVTVLGGFA